MGIKEATQTIALSLLAVFLLTGWGEFERIECLDDYERVPVYQLSVTSPTGSGLASAVIVAPGYALTASHAVEDNPPSILVLTPSGPRKATRVASDPSNDLALLALDTTGLVPIEFYQGVIEVERVIWTAGFAGDAGITYKGLILVYQGGRLTVGAPGFPGMSGGAIITCEDGSPYLAGIISSFNYRTYINQVYMIPGGLTIYQQDINDGTTNGPGGLILPVFTEYAKELYEEKEREKEQE